MEPLYTFLAVMLAFCTVTNGLILFLVWKIRDRIEYT
jgi:hypothetical protein